jgi:signal transduction histidine kinase
MNDPTQTDLPGEVPLETLRELVHDLRNPLVAAFGFLNLLERAEPGPAAERYTCAVRESLEALRDILDRARAIYGGGNSSS